MSRWEQEHTIDARIVEGELYVSASDVVAWIRHAAIGTGGLHGHCALLLTADALAGMCLDGTRGLVDGNES